MARQLIDSLGSGVHDVRFLRNITACAWTGTVGDGVHALRGSAPASSVVIDRREGGATCSGGGSTLSSITMLERLMQSLDSDQVSIVIEAAPEQVFDLVADVTRMPLFSPELLECRWLDGATEATVGARFSARNKVTRGPSWVNKPVITAVEQGRAISWARTEPFGGTVEWSYRFDPTEGGTRVTESYRVTKPIGRIGWLIIGTMSATKDRRGQLRTGMQETLQRLKTVVEPGSSLPA